CCLAGSPAADETVQAVDELEMCACKEPTGNPKRNDAVMGRLAGIRIRDWVLVLRHYTTCRGPQGRDETKTDRLMFSTTVSWATSAYRHGLPPYVAAWAEAWTHHCS